MRSVNLLRVWVIIFGSVGLWGLGLGTALASSSLPHEVHVGAYINDIQNLELQSHSYAVDIYMWMRWKDPVLDPPSTMEFVNPFELWGHTKTMEFPKPQLLSTGDQYQVIRNLGRFSTKLALYDYPFDRQTLVVEIEDASLSDDELRYVIAEDGIKVSPDLIIPGFKIGTPTIQVVTHDYPTNFGNIGKTETHGSSRVRIEVPIVRPVLTYSVKLMLPVLCVIFTAGLMFFFSPTFVDARVGIGITALLTIVALQITLNEDLPEVDYLVLMDKIYLASYFFVIASLATVVRTTRMFELGHDAAAVAFNRRALVVLSSLYFLSTSAIIALGWG
jgi:hypothetical protein